MPVVGGKEPRTLARSAACSGAESTGSAASTVRAASRASLTAVMFVPRSAMCSAGQTVLPVAEEVARAALAQVGLRNLKAVGRVAQHLQRARASSVCASDTSTQYD